LSAYTRREYLQTMAAGSLALGSSGLLAACGGSNSASSSSPSTTSGTVSGTPKRGGTLTVGFTGGGSGDTINPLAPVANVDYARVLNLYDLFAQITPKGTAAFNVVEEMVPNAKATQWDIRLRPGITFHNGKEATAEDVIYTFQLNVNPKAPGEAAAALAALDTKGMKKLDKYTARLPFSRPLGTLVQVLATNVAPYLVPVGFNPKTDKPIGTGPFKYQSFTPGQQSMFVRNENYWQTGLPYAETLVMVDYSDETAQTNSLVSGQSHAIAGVSTDVKAQLESAGQKLLVSNGGGFNPFTMRVDAPPFNDVRVRQAMRLIVDRKQMRDVVFSGLGLLGNDVFGVFAPEYDHSLPQRSQDIEQAKSLLKAAGHENLTVELVTADIAQGVVKCAQVLAQQASAAGVKINLRQITVSEFFGQNYLKWVFAQDYWDYNFYLPQVADATLPGAFFNETHFNDPQYTSLYNQAVATLDETQRTQICHQMQMIDYNQGSYIIPFFIPIIDAYGPKVGGATAGIAGQSFNNYDFKHMWLT
jgi:peptide/nickel transport system substrate-binding protein